MTDQPILTDENGAPVADNQRSQSAGPEGPLLLQDHHLIEKLARFDRERIPERVVHARGSGAYGTFELTRNCSAWTRAKFLTGVGKKTEMFQRFSTVALERGSPEATHQFTWLFGDRGIPASYRNLDGFGSHTFQWTNARGEIFWVKYHFKTDQGIKNLTSQEAAAISATNPDHHHQDLLHSIETGQFPSWTVKVQIMPAAEAASYRFNPFDLTKVWYYRDYPLITIGKLTLNRNPDNYFAEVEQAAFNPANFVPGIGPSPDKMLQGRLFAYGDTQRYRLGINHTQLPVNRPRTQAGVHNYGRDGAMRFDANGKRAKNYEPNSFDGPAETNVPIYAGVEVAGVTGSHKPVLHKEDSNFVQAGALYRLMKPDEKDRLIANIAGNLGKVSRDDIIARAIGHFRAADADYGARLETAIKAFRAKR